MVFVTLVAAPAGKRALTAVELEEKRVLPVVAMDGTNVLFVMAMEKPTATCVWMVFVILAMVLVGKRVRYAVELAYGRTELVSAVAATVGMSVIVATEPGNALTAVV